MHIIGTSRRHKTAAASAVIALLMSTAGPVTAADGSTGRFEIIELKGLPGLGTQVVGINGHGTTIGVSRSGDHLQALRWDDTGHLTVLDKGGYAESMALDISEDGTVVGAVIEPGRGPHAARWDADGGLTILETLPGGLDWSQAWAINRQGEIAGDTDLLDNTLRSVRWDRRGHISELELPQNMRWSQSYGINDRGMIVGNMVGPNGAPSHTARWDERGRVTDLGTLPDGNWSFATLINERGEVAGNGNVNSTVGQHGIRWGLDGKAVDLGTLGGSYSAVSGMNRRGVIVGSATNAADLVWPVKWMPTGGIVQLDLPRDRTWAGASATAVNDQGDVVGSGTGADGHDRALMWTREGRAIELPTLPGATYSSPKAINASGSVIGETNADDGSNHAVLWRRR